MRLKFLLLLPFFGGCSLLDSHRSPSFPRRATSNDLVREALGGKYLVPDIFKEELSPGSIIDVKDRDFSLVFRPKDCLQEYLTSSGRLSIEESGAATIPEIQHLSEVTFDLSIGSNAKMFLGELGLGASSYRLLSAELGGLSYSRIPLGKARLHHECNEVLMRKWGARMKRDKSFDGLVFVIEVIYSTETLVKLNLQRQGAVSIDVLLTRLLEVNPKARATKLDNDTLRINQRRYIALTPANLTCTSCEDAAPRNKASPAVIKGHPIIEPTSHEFRPARDRSPNSKRSEPQPADDE